MATLSAITPALTGTSLSLASAGASDKFTNPKGTAIAVVTNNSGSSITATLTARTTTRPASGQFPAATIADQVVSIANGATKIIGPIPTCFNDANGDVTLTCSATSSVTVGFIQP